MQVAEKRCQQLYPGKSFSSTAHSGKLCASKMEISWSDKEGWEVIPHAKPCEVMRKIEFY